VKQENENLQILDVCVSHNSWNYIQY
jgi:hypothetical protein